MLDTLPACEGDECSEQRYKAVLAVIKDGRTVKDVAGQWSVSRQTVLPNNVEPATSGSAVYRRWCGPG